MTMKNTILLLAGFLLISSSCSVDDAALKMQAQQQLDVLYQALINMAGSVPCTNSQNWAFTAVGAKACGGPIGYLAYPLSIDTTNFLNKVAHFTAEQEKFNIKWQVFSDCMIVQPPTGVECVDNKPTFIY